MNIKDLVPAFEFENIDKDISLLENENAEVIAGEKSILCTATGTLRLAGKPKVYFDLNGGTDLYSAAMDQLRGNPDIRSTLRLVDRNTEIQQGLFYHVRAMATDYNIKWMVLSQPFIVLGTEETEVDCLSFYIFNGVPFSWQNPRYMFNTGNSLVPFKKLTCNQWVIEIKNAQLSSVYKELEDCKGNALTHIGIIRKIDSTPFKVDEIKIIRSGLSFMLSFAGGRRSFPSIFIGHKGDAKVYEDWSASFDQYSRVGTWWHSVTDTTSLDGAIEDLFPLFMEKWSIENWRTALCEAVNWFLSSNNTEKLLMEPCLILHQAAFERLAYEYIVIDKKIHTYKEFNSKRASDNIRTLFHSLRIPIDIPAELKKMTQLPGYQDWTDIPHALTDIRNSIIHPVHKHKLDSVICDVWNLSMEYIELVILGICGYNGKYQSRIKNCITYVPWSTNSVIGKGA